MKDCNRIITFHTDRIDNIPCIGIGTYNKSQKQLTELLIDYPFENLLIDTAAKYENEHEVGLSLKSLGLHRTQLFVIAKISYQQQCKNDVKQALSETLSNLQLNYVDLYLIHSPRNTNRNRTWEQMLRLKEEGLTKEIGVSNFTCEQIEELFHISGLYPAANQIVSHTMQKDYYNKLGQYCKDKRILIQDAQPFGGLPTKFLSDNYNSILKNNYKQRIVSIFGTTSSNHLKENISQFLERDMR